jgi:hypothetical protein
MAQGIVIHPVPRDGQFGDALEEVVEQDLHRQHGEEGEKKRSPGHAEHVAEIGYELCRTNATCSSYFFFSFFLIFFSAFFSFGVLAGSFLEVFLLSKPLLMMLSPYH